MSKPGSMNEYIDNQIIEFMRQEHALVKAPGQDASTLKTSKEFRYGGFKITVAVNRIYFDEDNYYEQQRTSTSSSDTADGSSTGSGPT